MKKISFNPVPLTSGGSSVPLTSGSSFNTPGFMKTLSCFLLALFFFSTLSAVDINFAKSWRNRKGVKQYEKKKFPDAGKQFNKNAVNNPTDGRLQYNLGNTNYKTGKVDDAMTAYQKALSDKNFKDQSKTYQNMGNIHYNKKEYQEALDDYKKAMINSPKNQDARYNFEMAKKAIAQQQQQQKQKQDQKKDEKKEQQKNQPQTQQDQKKKDADQLLKALMENERNDMKKKQQVPAKRPKNAKYW